MPFIETVPDLVETLCDLFGIYGAHDERCTDDARKMCRVCFAASIGERMRHAVANERMVEGRP